MAKVLCRRRRRTRVAIHRGKEKAGHESRTTPTHGADYSGPLSRTAENDVLYMSLEPLKRCSRGSLLLPMYSQAASADLLVYSLVTTKVGEGLPDVEAKKEAYRIFEEHWRKCGDSYTSRAS